MSTMFLLKNVYRLIDRCIMISMSKLTISLLHISDIFLIKPVFVYFLPGASVRLGNIAQVITIA